MKKFVSLVLGLCIVALLPLSLVGCGGSGTTLRIYNYGDYMAEEVLQGFQEAHPEIQIQYDLYDSNESMLAKMEGGATYDIIFPSDYAVEKLVKMDLLQELDHSKLPNMENLGEQFLDRAFDPGNKYSVPYTWGTMGILYDKTKIVEPVTSWGALFDTRYKGQVLMNDSVRDSMAAALIYLGYSSNSTDETELREAADLLIQQRKDGIVQAYMGDNIRDTMINNGATLALTFSGDALEAMQQNENLDYVVPTEGSNMWLDNIVLTKYCTDTDAAYLFIDYLLTAESAVYNVNYICYSTPNVAALPDLDPELAENPVFWPGDDVLERCEVYIDLEEKEAMYSELWMEIKSAN